MRGTEEVQDAMFSYISAEQRVPKDHPLRPIRRIMDEVLKRLSPQFEQMYSTTGRPSIAPEKLLRALVLQALYTVRSERMLMEQLDYNLLFRWFVGLQIDDGIWDVTVFTKNRERLLEADVAQKFLKAVLEEAQTMKLLSNEHFTVDGTLIKAWAGQKSFKKKDGDGKTPPPDDPGNPTINFRGEKRSNETHQSKTDPECRLYRKGGQESLLSYLGHVLMENRNGLVIKAQVSTATGTAERDSAVEMIREISRSGRITEGADKAYDTKQFVADLRGLKATPHVAQNICRNRTSAIDLRTVAHPGYSVSQKKRKRVEEVFGWMKTVGMMRQVHHRGTKKVGWMFTLAAATYNMVRMRNLMAAAHTNEKEIKISDTAQSQQHRNL
jgi:transposase